MAGSSRARGFTTIELAIAVTIIGVLVVLAYPVFFEQVRKSRRADGIASLASLQQAQERWRSTNAAYAPNSELTTGLRQASRSSAGYYDLGIVSASATGYVASATAVTGTSQAADTACTSLWVRMEAGNLSYGSGTTVDWTDAKRCWAR